MSEVWKFSLFVADAQFVQMPAEAALVHVAEQGDQVCLWARVDPSKRPVQRLILIRGTGHPVGDESYIGSVLVAGGTFVWHLFDGGEA